MQAPTPIIFLFPDALGSAAVYRPGAVRAVAPGSVSLRNEPVEALNHMLERHGARLVLTHDGRPYDARDHLLAIGVRPRLHADWLTDQRASDRGTAIARWWEAHGKPPALIIDRPGVSVPGITRIEINEASAGLTIEVANQAMAMVSPASEG